MAEPSKRKLDIVDAGLATVAEASRFLSISRSTLYEMMNEGQLPYVTVRGGRRIPWKSLKELAAQGLRNCG